MQFGTPPWGQSIAAHFNLPLSAFDGHITGYVAQNDLVLDLLVDQSGQLEKFHWFVRAHLENSAGELSTAGATSEKQAARQAGADGESA